MNFYIRCVFLGIGLAMDASAVSMANGLNEPKMKLWKIGWIAFLFAFFQAMMPLIGYFVGHAFLTYIEKMIPWIALVLLSVIGGKMLYEGIRKQIEEETNFQSLGLKTLLLQAIATSIDALSVGFTISDYSTAEALICVGLVAFVTFGICFVSVFIGKKFGLKLGKKAEILGGLILIAIGIEIFVTGWFF